MGLAIVSFVRRRLDIAMYLTGYRRNNPSTRLHTIMPITPQKEIVRDVVESYVADEGARSLALDDCVFKGNRHRMVVSYGVKNPGNIGMLYEKCDLFCFDGKDKRPAKRQVQMTHENREKMKAELAELGLLPLSPLTTRTASSSPAVTPVRRVRKFRPAQVRPPNTPVPSPTSTIRSDMASPPFSQANALSPQKTLGKHPRASATSPMDPFVKRPKASNSAAILSSPTPGRASTSGTPQSPIIIEDSEEELDLTQYVFVLKKKRKQPKASGSKSVYNDDISPIDISD